MFDRHVNVTYLHNEPALYHLIRLWMRDDPQSRPSDRIDFVNKRVLTAPDTPALRALRAQLEDELNAGVQRREQIQSTREQRAAKVEAVLNGSDDSARNVPSAKRLLDEFVKGARQDRDDWQQRWTKRVKCARAWLEERQQGAL